MHEKLENLEDFLVVITDLLNNRKISTCSFSLKFQNSL